jgi:hypothetical protein
VVWVFNSVGAVDLLNAFYPADRLGIGIDPGLQAAAYFIPTVLAPLLLVTHVLVFCILLRRDAMVGETARSSRRSATRLQGLWNQSAFDHCRSHAGGGDVAPGRARR